MLISLLHLGLAAAMIGGPGDSLVEFDAVLRPEPEAALSVADANGFGAVTFDGSNLRFDVSVVDLKHIIEIAVMDRGRAVALYDAADSPGRQLHIEGTISSDRVTDLPFSELVDD